MHLILVRCFYVYRVKWIIGDFQSEPRYFGSFFFLFFLGSQTVSITSLGCYQDRVTNQTQRVFPTLFLQVNVWNWWPDTNRVIQACTRAAATRGYRIFSVQDLGDCRWGPNAERDYARYGIGQYCYRGVGWFGSGSVYRVRASGPGELSLSWQ